MGHSIGDGIIVMALAAAFLGFFYLKFLERQRRLEILHQERLAAMEKGFPCRSCLLTRRHRLSPRTRESF